MPWGRVAAAGRLAVECEVVSRVVQVAGAPTEVVEMVETVVATKEVRTEARVETEMVAVTGSRRARSD